MIPAATAGATMAAASAIRTDLAGRRNTTNAAAPATAAATPPRDPVSRTAA